MSDKIKVAEAIERQAKTYQAIIDAAAMLKEIGSLEQARDEIVKSHLAATDEALAAKLELHNVKAEVKKAKDKAAEIIADAAEEVNNIMATAQANASDIVLQAQAEAKKIDQDAVDRLAASLADVNANRARIVNEINNAQDKLDCLGLDIQSKEAEAAESQKKLDKVQAQIAKLLG